MPPPKKGNYKRGFKACDPFCEDKVRVALYNRPNGPHQGKLVLGKTYLSGLDGKCFSRTGRIKKGYRNVPIDLQREFEIEKRQIEKTRSMFQTPMSRQQRKLKNHKNAQIASQQTPSTGKEDGSQTKETVSPNETTPNSDKTDTQLVASKHTPQPSKSTKKAVKKNHEIVKLENELQKIQQSQQQMRAEEPAQAMDKLSRLRGESFDAFLQRVKKTTAYHLEQQERKEYQKTLKRKHSALEKKLRAKQKQIALKRQQKVEHVQRVREQKTFEHRMQPKIEHVPFGATNAAPPTDLRKLGQQLFGKRLHDKNVRNAHNVNIAKLSFADNIQKRALQMKKDEVLKNYSSMKRKQYTKEKAVKLKNSKRKVWW